MQQPDGAIDAEFVDHIFDLSDRVAVVTGGASGLGRAMALGLAHAGARVIVGDLDGASAQAFANDVRGSTHPVEGHPLDVTDTSSIEALVQDVIRRHDRVDVLINSAGIAHRAAAEDFPEEAWDRVIGINLKGSFLTCQIVGRHMLRQGRGAIINIASIGASVAYPHATAYLQSKGGVAQLTRSLALEWIHRGVRVNALAPSLFETPLVRASDAKESLTSEWIRLRTPIGRRGQPHELVGPAIFLASDAASMVTGHVLQVDGGYLIA